MSGLLALLDDVAGIAKIAAASVDDVIGQAAKAGSKAAGAVIDDAAVTPKYVTGFDASRELPIIWRIARGSLINKLVFLLPVGLALSAFAPGLIAPLLMLGGLYLCFEGADKVAHALGVGAHHGGPDGSHAVGDPAHLEEQKVRGAIKTDFILSAEIMTIALAAIPAGAFWMEAATLAAVAVMITAAVYGAVAVIVKMDDAGLYLSLNAYTRAGRALGRGIVRGMPGFLKALMLVGTAAMLWLGGSILVHGAHELGWHGPEEAIKGFAEGLSPTAAGRWAITALLDGVLGLAVGAALVPPVTKVMARFTKA
jgi:predicted DNA repair protein MutK